MNVLKSLLRICAAGGCRASGLLALAERRNRNRLTILCFHRVLPADRKRMYFGPDLIVTPGAFHECCRLLRERFDVRPLHEAVEAWSDRRTSGRPLATITFDDGYRDNHQYAAPILAEWGLRATFFVIADLVGAKEISWYDRMGRALMRLNQDGRLGNALREHPVGQSLTYDLNVASAAATARRIIGQAKRVEPEDRRSLLEHLADVAGMDETAMSEDQIMDREQLLDLTRAGHEIGSHSRTHEILPLLDDAALVRETVESRQVIEETLGQPVRSFCYPNGDHDDRVVAAVKAAGYTAAVITQPGNNDPGTDPYRLQRWFIHEERLSGPSGGTSATLLRTELSGLADRVFNRHR